jgi:hypothetical protein
MLTTSLSNIKKCIGHAEEDEEVVVVVVVIGVVAAAIALGVQFLFG